MKLSLLVLLLCFSGCLAAKAFRTGPVFHNHGKHTPVESIHKLDQSSEFKMAFDVGKVSGEHEYNTDIDKLARFINMHVASGVPIENIDLALVVHGKAVRDLIDKKHYKERYDEKNPNHELVTALLSKGVKIIVCGQSSSNYNFENEYFIENVEVSLSAMTAHSILNKQGYTLNPF